MKGPLLLVDDGQAEIADLVQMYALSLTSGRLEVREGDCRGEIWFERGRIVHAQAGDLEGDEAFYLLMTWSAGEVALSRDSARAPRATIGTSWQHLLLEGARRMDEGGRESYDLGEDPEEPDDLSLRFGRTGALEPAGDAAAFDTLETGNGMANIEEGLQRLAELDGFVGACLVDSHSGTLVGSQGGGSLSLEAAAVGNSKVIRAKRQTISTLHLKDSIEDILITLGRQYHLIRPIATNEELFLYLVLDKTRANLALARHKLADTERGFAR